MKSCPICKNKIKSVQHGDSFPFCSERCKLIDLGDWLTENHKIPVEDNGVSVNDLDIKNIEH